MSDSITQAEGERDDIINVQCLIEAVRGSRAAQVLYELRQWLPRFTERQEDGTASASAAPLNL